MMSADDFDFRPMVQLGGRHFRGEVDIYRKGGRLADMTMFDVSWREPISL